MHEAWFLVMALAVGLGLGAFFFIGLWWSLRRALQSQHPALWLISSLLLRMAVVLLGFYYVAGGHWQRLMACLVGFMLARVLVTRLAPAPAPTDMGSEESTHAP